MSIECKFGSNKPTLDQLEFMRMVEQAGGVSMVVGSVDDLADELDLWV